MAVRVAAATDKAPLHNGKPSRIRTLKPPQRHWRGYTRGVQHLRHYATDHCRNTAGFAPPSSPLCPRKFTTRTRLGAFLFLFVYFVYFVFYAIFSFVFLPRCVARLSRKHRIDSRFVNRGPTNPLVLSRRTFTARTLQDTCPTTWRLVPARGRIREEMPTESGTGGTWPCKLWNLRA